MRIGVARRLVACHVRRSLATQPSTSADFSNYPLDKIRNFCIAAHVDHGKSTLADRIIERASGKGAKVERAQLLDSLAVERERGITVKAQSCALPYRGVLLNLVDTPGHVDFAFEVRRSVAVCDTMLLLVAANAGVQAQTIANFGLAVDHQLKVFALINKIDMKEANVDKVLSQLSSLFEIEEKDCLLTSAKTGIGIDDVLDTLVTKAPPPKDCSSDGSFESLVFDSTFHQHRGVIAWIRVKSGSVQRGSSVRSTNSDKLYEVVEVGVARPHLFPTPKLSAGQVGYIICHMKTTDEARAGDRIYCANTDLALESSKEPMFRPLKPTLFAGLFPMDTQQYDAMRAAMDRLALNDPSVQIEPDSSQALGHGWKVGVMGTLHLEVLVARLQDEFDIEAIITAPSVEFIAEIKDHPTIRKRVGAERLVVRDATKFPEEQDVQRWLEPMVKVHLVTRQEHFSAVCALCEESRGKREHFMSLDVDNNVVIYRIPLAEVAVGFFDQLKRITSGLTSCEYAHDGYAETRITLVVIRMNGKPVDDLSFISPTASARARAQQTVRRLKATIPRQQFDINITATEGRGKATLASALINAYRKDFMQLLKGNVGKGGLQRLNKKLSHQKEGKTHLKEIGKVLVPKEAFITVLSTKS